MKDDVMTVSRGVLIVVLGLALLVLAPHAAALVCAAWFAELARPLLDRLARVIGGRRRSAALVTMTLVVVVAAPVLGVGLVAVSQALRLFHDLASTKQGGALLTAWTSRGAIDFGWGDVLDVARDHSEATLRAIRALTGTITGTVLSFLVFLLATYTFLVDGARIWGWVERHAPIPRAQLPRYAAAFHETGRGLLVGVCLTALSQGALATIVYLVLGIPRAIPLGLLTMVAAVVPVLGTALVWGPLSIGLALQGRVTAALVLFALGALAIGTVDNVLRSRFARVGKFELPTFVTVTAIFGGLAIAGIQGAILGPLIVRLAMEALELAAESKELTS